MSMMGNAITQSITKIENPKNPCWVAMLRRLIAPARAQPMTYHPKSNITAMAAIMMYWSSVILSVFHEFKHADDGYGDVGLLCQPSEDRGAVYAGKLSEVIDVQLQGTHQI